MTERKTPWFRTDRHAGAEERVREAVRLIIDARRVLTMSEFEEFVRDNIADLGYHGFIGSIGQAMVNAATIEVGDLGNDPQYLERRSALKSNDNRGRRDG